MNPFEAVAAAQLTAAAKRKHKDADRRAAKSVVQSDADAPMKGSPAEEARDVRSAQMANYRRHKADERDALCNGPYGEEATQLMAKLKKLTFDIDSACQLTKDVLAEPWLTQVDANTRQVVLSIVADHILRLRMRAGLSPFDDAIGDEPPTAFQIIRKGLMGV